MDCPDCLSTGFDRPWEGVEQLRAQLADLQAKYDAALAVIEEAKNPLETMDCESAGDVAVTRDEVLTVLSRVNPKEQE